MTDGYVRADVYDALYTKMKNYGVEASRVYLQAIEELSTRPECLLDVACGTGLHLQHFAHWFHQSVGVDLSEVQLSAARQLLPPKVELLQGNMLELSSLFPEELFDVVTCLFSAIGHMTTLTNLRRAIKQMAMVLNEGGLLFVEPWLSPDKWENGRLSLETAEKPGFKVSRMTLSERRGRVTQLEMHYMVGTPDGISDFNERHDLALYTQAEYKDAFRRAGLDVRFDPEGLSNNGRGIYIGTKPI